MTSLLPQLPCRVPQAGSRLSALWSALWCGAITCKIMAEAALLWHGLLQRSLDSEAV